MVAGIMQGLEIPLGAVGEGGALGSVKNGRYPRALSHDFFPEN